MKSKQNETSLRLDSIERQLANINGVLNGHLVDCRPSPPIVDRAALIASVHSLQITGSSRTSGGPWRNSVSVDEVEALIRRAR